MVASTYDVAKRIFWELIPTGEENTYFIKNTATGRYIGSCNKTPSSAFFEAASADSVAGLHFVITHIRSSFLLLRSGLGGGTGFCLQSSLR